MKIKKYTGESFQEAFEKMKRELGQDAIILNSRKVKPSNAIHFLGGKDHYEITAAIDNAPNTTNSGNDSSSSVLNGISRKRNGSSRGESLSSQGITEEKFLQQISRLDSLKEEVQDMKKVLEDVADFLKYSRMPALPAIFKNMLKRLVDNEVHEELAKAIVQTVYARTEPGDYNKPKVVFKNLFELLQQMIKTAPPLENRKHKPYIVALVGPTGVGKTTTIAKIAANMKLFHQKDVALISADTYRIAAIEQLQTFANIAHIPMKVAYAPKEMEEAVEHFKDKDLILIDTIGRSPKNEPQIRDLQLFIDAADPNEVHLVMSLTSSLKTLFEILQRFGKMRPNRLIFTKLDETDSPGLFLNVLYKYPIPVSYITTGQTVPNDIVAAEKERLSQLVYYGEWQK
ncbi:MAG: flagellar biosynthesis protein FlhF [Calditrichaeota bacterium]|nr:MAG: flagellar biosynthesis protein FlhF [Calditrichota bacterium]